MSSTFEQRRTGKLPSPGPFLAEVTNHLDPTYMGSIEVAVKKGIPNSALVQRDTYIVKYLSPFAGITSARHTGTANENFNDVQKSYGMWMIPPDIGTEVMVIFIDGDPNQGFYIGCIPSTFQNHMMPGIAASANIDVNSDQRAKYDVDILPVAEFLKNTESLNNTNVSSFKKAVHPFADVLLKQGLLADTVRGVTSSSARRETPSAVFGISTPGPVDTSDGAKKGKIGYTGNRQVPVSRLGGTTFVMDDGDIAGENELVRIRTRTGHQILMHNSKDLIYIGNSSGSSWIEMTGAGKIDIYAEDSVSIHTKADFNFRADRDINLEAGRHIHTRAMGNMETNVTGFYYLTVDDHAKIVIKNDKDETVGQTSRTSVGVDLHLSSSKDTYFTAGNNMNLGSVNDMLQGSGGNFNIGASGYYRETASKIDMNGPAAASPASANPATTPPKLPTYSLPNTNSSSPWKGNRYSTVPLTSIMQRVPTHEPYPQHESLNPKLYSADSTDATLQSRASSGIADNPNIGKVTSANYPPVVPGTCDPIYAKDINAATSQTGINAIKDACKKLDITNPYAESAILSIVGGESRWIPQTESFNYTTAARLLEVFPSVFKGNVELAQKYVGNPKNRLPEFLYGSDTSKGQALGNILPGDGAKYIGRGYIQLTGRSNYSRYGKLLYERKLLASANELVNNPEIANESGIGALIAVIYFIDRVKLDQSDPGYFEAAVAAVGNNTTDIYQLKSGYYQCFYGQLSGQILQSGSSTIVTDSSGNPVKTGIK